MENTAACIKLHITYNVYADTVRQYTGSWCYKQASHTVHLTPLRLIELPITFIFHAWLVRTYVSEVNESQIEYQPRFMHTPNHIVNSKRLAVNFLFFISLFILLPSFLYYIYTALWIYSEGRYKHVYVTIKIRFAYCRRHFTFFPPRDHNIHLYSLWLNVYR